MKRAMKLPLLLEKSGITATGLQTFSSPAVLKKAMR